MNKFHADEFQVSLSTLEELAHRLELMQESPNHYEGDRVPKEILKETHNALQMAIVACGQDDFVEAVRAAKRAAFALDRYNPDFSLGMSELRHTANAMRDELEKRTFITVEPRFTDFIDNDCLMGTEVLLSFKDAAPDIVDAGNCIAADCGTAAVFHLMRVVEWGLRALCIDLGLIRAKRRHKSGKVQYVSISFTDWETMLNQLHGKVEQRIEKLKRGPLKQKQQELYFPILQEIKAIRDAWRNHVMHTRAQYSVDDAVIVLGHVGRIMASLASNIKEPVKKQKGGLLLQRAHP
jgi:hypothetical protein